MKIRIRSAQCDHYLGEPCDVCEAEAKRPVATARYHPFKAGFYEHVSYEGAYCETADDLRRACEANGAYSVYLENSLHKGRIGKIKEI